ncbi:AzlD domain-containing protein [Aerococcaceae bacterium DSM 111176]|nr:AzlD domain-containing protein [Aerococcaceae bacterium DSM 111176]
MTTQQAIITLFIFAGMTMLTRFLVFWVFPAGSNPPIFIHYLGKVLPASAIALLVVYALKDVSITNAPHGIPELIALLVIAAIHKWKRNTLLSIATGTILYMVLVQFVF